MTIAIDSHESIELELLLSQVLDVERTDLNQDGRPDIWFLNRSGKQVGIELKQAGEALGSLDSVEEQLGREMRGCEHLALGIRGVVTPSAAGFCQVWEKSKNNPSIMFAGREFKQPYTGYRAWLARLQELGVLVIEVPDVESMALSIAALYNLSMKSEAEHKTFSRLIVEDYWIKEEDEQKRNLALTLMGLRPKWGGGEEVCLALAEHFPSLKTLLDTLESGADVEIAAVKLRTGKRTIGPAAVAALKKAVGI